MKIEKIEVEIKTPVQVTGSTDREVFETIEEAVQTIGAESALKRLNYGHDLFVRRSLRERLLKANEGPEKADAKAVKGLMALGLTEAAAKAQVAAIRSGATS